MIILQCLEILSVSIDKLEAFFVLILGYRADGILECLVDDSVTFK